MGSCRSDLSLISKIKECFEELDINEWDLPF